ncbi:MAG: hypothetical protein ACLP0B_27850 [Steroidobacteraceae bacterium]|jgi:hypothetical protein
MSSRESTFSSEFNGRIPKLGLYSSDAKFSETHADSVEAMATAGINLARANSFMMASPSKWAAQMT